MGEIEELNSIFTDIANSIRAKLDVSTSYYPEDMADAIDSISGGEQTSEYSYEIITKSTGGFDAAITVKKYVDDVLEYSTDYPYQSLQVEPVFFDGLFSLQYGKGGQVKYTLTLYEKSDVHPSGYVYEQDYNVTVDLTETFIVGGGATILSGTSAPSSPQGRNGDIYLQYHNNDMVTLPTGYTALNYIENPLTGTASINTNVSVTADTSADLIGLEPLQQSRYGTFLGQGNQSGRIQSIRFKESTNKVQFQIGNDNTAIEGASLIVGERYDIHAENGKLVVNGTEYIGSTMTLGEPMYTLRLFDNGNDERAYIRLFRCKIYEDGIMIRDMVAARYDNNNTIGMYDLVNDVFYTSTSGALNGGSILVANEITNVYLKVNGAQQSLIGSDLDDVG